MLFGLAVFVLSYFLEKKIKSLDEGTLSVYIVLIAWGSLICGLCMAKLYLGGYPIALRW